MSMNS